MFANYRSTTKLQQNEQTPGAQLPRTKFNKKTGFRKTLRHFWHPEASINVVLPNVFKILHHQRCTWSKLRVAQAVHPNGRQSTTLTTPKHVKSAARKLSSLNRKSNSG
jgi:hypothetical protein